MMSVATLLDSFDNDWLFLIVHGGALVSFLRCLLLALDVFLEFNKGGTQV